MRCSIWRRCFGGSASDLAKCPQARPQLGGLRKVAPASREVVGALVGVFWASAIHQCSAYEHRAVHRCHRGPPPASTGGK
jgi:hypothetical protein